VDGIGRLLRGALAAGLGADNVLVVAVGAAAVEG
jgi:hypothetical protein